MTQVERMRKAGFTEEEIRDMLEADARIDKGEKLFEQTAEQKAVTKKMTQARAAVNAYGKKVTRERKPNEVKRKIMQFIFDALRVNSGCQPLAPNAELTNPERTIDFQIDGRNFTLTLTEHRAPKN